MLDLDLDLLEVHSQHQNLNHLDPPLWTKSEILVKKSLSASGFGGVIIPSLAGCGSCT